MKLYNNIGICLRKKSTKGEKVTAGDLLNSSYVEYLVQHNDGYKSFQGVRPSPSHWQHKNTKLMADIRNVQVHKHTATCRKGKYKEQICRFGIPYFLMART